MKQSSRFWELSSPSSLCLVLQCPSEESVSPQETSPRIVGAITAAGSLLFLFSCVSLRSSDTQSSYICTNT